MPENHHPKVTEITVATGFIERQSDTANKRFVFAYTITIKNISEQALQLMSRHWFIQDANNKVEEVVGEGVVGEQPLIKPGESYTYTSGAVLETEMGTMQGKYFLVDESKQELEAEIPKFVLSVPRVFTLK